MLRILGDEVRDTRHRPPTPSALGFCLASPGTSPRGPGCVMTGLHQRDPPRGVATRLRSERRPSAAARPP
jgi:hypothetical protein